MLLLVGDGTVGEGGLLVLGHSVCSCVVAFGYARRCPNQTCAVMELS